MFSHEWPCGVAGYCLPKEQQRLWDERRGIAKEFEEVEDSEGSVEEVEEVLPDASAQGKLSFLTPLLAHHELLSSVC